ncbi:MAG: outer membrane beta-barrel protein [Bacillota bacterium]
MKKRFPPRLALRGATAITLAALGLHAQAQTAPAPADAKPAEAKPAEPPPPPPPIFSIGGFDLTGHFDMAYTHLSGSGKFVSGANDRVFDFKRDDFIFHALDLQLAKTPDNGFGGLLDVTIGKDADTIAAYGTIDKDKGPANGAHHYFDVTQAYLHYGAAPFTIIAGKFVTLAGAEVIKSDGDTNYSRSILFGYAIPFTHTGVRATYKMSDALSFIAGVNQGWDAVSDVNSDKTVELGATYAPTKEMSFAAAYYGGKSLVSYYPKSVGVKGERNLLDLVGTFTLSEQVTLILNYDYGSQEALGSKAKWDGLAGYLNYQFNDQWRVSLRGEYFDDKDGYRTGIVQKWKEGTLTLAYLPSKPLEIRAEVRADKSDVPAFLKSDGVGTTDKQHSVGLEVLYKF